MPSRAICTKLDSSCVNARSSAQSHKDNQTSVAAQREASTLYKGTICYKVILVMLILVNQNRFFRFFQVLEVHSANMVAPIMLSKCKQCNFPIKLWYTQVSKKKWIIFFFSPQRTLAKHAHIMQIS